MDAYCTCTSSYAASTPEAEATLDRIEDAMREAGQECLATLGCWSPGSVGVAYLVTTDEEAPHFLAILTDGAVRPATAREANLGW